MDARPGDVYGRWGAVAISPPSGQAGAVATTWRTWVRCANLPASDGLRSVIAGPAVQVVIARPSIIVRPSWFFRLLGFSTFEAQADSVVVERVERRDSGVRLIRPDGQWAVVWTRRVDQLVGALDDLGVRVGPEVITLSTNDLA